MTDPHKKKSRSGPNIRNEQRRRPIVYLTLSVTEREQADAIAAADGTTRSGAVGACIRAEWERRQLDAEHEQRVEEVRRANKRRGT